MGLRRRNVTRPPDRGSWPLLLYLADTSFLAPSSGYLKRLRERQAPFHHKDLLSGADQTNRVRLALIDGSVIPDHSALRVSQFLFLLFSISGCGVLALLECHPSSEI